MHVACSVLALVCSSINCPRCRSSFSSPESLEAPIPTFYPPTSGKPCHSRNGFRAVSRNLEKEFENQNLLSRAKNSSNVSHVDFKNMISRLPVSKREPDEDIRCEMSPSLITPRVDPNLGTFSPSTVPGRVFAPRVVCMEEDSSTCESDSALTDISHMELDERSPSPVLRTSDLNFLTYPKPEVSL